MAIYDSNKSYVCEKCGLDTFTTKEVFLIEEVLDNTKITPVMELKRSSVAMLTVCTSCGHQVSKPVKS